LWQLFGYAFLFLAIFPPWNSLLFLTYSFS
jgi:hypothetical protein